MQVASWVTAGALAGAVVSAPSDNASLIALIGVIIAALLTATGGITSALLTRRRDAAGLVSTGGDTAYLDCRHDLAEANAHIALLEAEVDEMRTLNEQLLQALRERAESKDGSWPE